MKLKGPKFSGFKFKRPTNLTLPLLVLLFFVLIIGSGFIFFYVYLQNKWNAEYLGYIAEQKLLSQRIATSALEAASGKDDAFANLELFRSQYQRSLDLVRSGNPNTQLPALSVDYSDQVGDLSDTWEEYKLNVDSIINQRALVADIARYVRNVSAVLKPLERLSEDIAVELSSTDVDNQTLYVASRQSLFVERTQNNLNQILSGAEGASTAVDQFKRDFDFYGRVVDSLINGSRELEIQQATSVDAQNMLVRSQEAYGRVQTSVAGIQESAPSLFEVKDAAAAIQVISPDVLSFSVRLENSIVNSNDKNVQFVFIAGTAFGLAIILGIIIAYVLLKDARRRASDSVAINQKNQEAILRLLDEMTALAEGDLTAHATVTEDITGAIADSVNFSIDALRSLVEAINNTVVRVSQSSEHTQSIANRLADASSQQATEIASATDAISSMAQTMEKVSQNAMTSADVALKSVEIAHKGAETVRRNIEGMDSIRETIQETSKRIKRLGESSQQIGEIVSLITDIADRTNILALNAAIQASSAGEAGRGFAVVADEVQRLAERAGNATKQISALVETIQTDTNEAVSSMEQSTAGVVTGAKLAEDAGNALNEIETVSKELADLIQGISVDAREQATTAVSISESMNVIQRITLETSEGTNETAKSIGNLTELANELRTSVAGFKLPESDEIRVAVNQ